MLYALDYREFACYYPDPAPPTFATAARMPPRFWIIWSFASRTGESGSIPARWAALSPSNAKEAMASAVRHACSNEPEIFPRASATRHVREPSHGMHSHPPAEAERKQ